MSDKQSLPEFPNQRLFDLVRQQRAELHEAELITDEEYLSLAMFKGPVQRLEDYDALKLENERLQKEVKSAFAECHDQRERKLVALEANTKLVELVGRVSNHVICHLPTCGNGDCTCGLTALRAEIERVKGKTI